MNTTLGLVLLALAPAAIYAQDTDIWLGDVSLNGGRWSITKLVNITQRPGYDNQPAFFRDQKTLAYTTEVGKETFAVLYDLSTRKVTTVTDAKGYSPTPTADGKQLMMLHEGRVKLHELNGRLIQPLTDTKDAGYFSPVDERTWVLFMNDNEQRIAIYDAEKKALETMSRGAITPPFQIPNERAFTFVAETPFSSDSAESTKIDRASVKLELRKLDLTHHRVETLAVVPFPATGHHTWTPRNTLLIASGSTIYEWNPLAPDTWKPMITLSHPDLQHISRIVVSPRGDRIALVSLPRDETLIRNARMASNAAIVAHEVNNVVERMEDDVVITRGSGALITGKSAVTKSFEEAFAQSKDLVYVRTTSRVEVSTSAPLAAEHGTWVGRWTTANGTLATANGTYLVMWRQTTGSPSGLPDWKIRSELYVTLGCTNCQ